MNVQKVSQKNLGASTAHLLLDAHTYHHVTGGAIRSDIRANCEIKIDLDMGVVFFLLHSGLLIPHAHSAHKRDANNVSI